MTKIRFKGSKSLRERRFRIKNTGKVREKANLFVEKSLKRKKSIREIREVRDKTINQ